MLSVGADRFDRPNMFSTCAKNTYALSCSRLASVISTASPDLYDGKGCEKEVVSGSESVVLARTINLKESPGVRRPEKAV